MEVGEGELVSEGDGVRDGVRDGVNERVLVNVGVKVKEGVRDEVNVRVAVNVGVEVKEGEIVWVKVVDGKLVIVRAEVNDGVGRISLGVQLEINPLHPQYKTTSTTK